MKLDMRESIRPNFYVNLSLLNSFFFFFKVQIFGYFFINELRFWLNFVFNNLIIEFIIFSYVILISMFFFYDKKIYIYVFLKAKTQFNYKHYF